VSLVNAFTGAVNIVTKDSLDNDASLRLQAGSYGQFSAAVTAGVSLNESNHIAFSKTYLTDIATIQISTINFVLKSVFNKINCHNDVCSFEKKVWGKWFYASPAAIDQYEETTASLVGFQRLSKR
jgi:iron complex outermembrane receptor protein